MHKTVNILEAQDFKEKGMYFYCTSEDIQSRSKAEILNWFSDAKKVILEKSDEFNIISIEPMISFTNNAAVMIRVDSESIPIGIYPVTAIID
jgi:hypothetical protein